jgi:hypothetical protein
VAVIAAAIRAAPRTDRGADLEHDQAHVEGGLRGRIALGQAYEAHGEGPGDSGPGGADRGQGQDEGELARRPREGLLAELEVDVEGLRGDQPDEDGEQPERGHRPGQWR